MMFIIDYLENIVGRNLFFYMNDFHTTVIIKKQIVIQIKEILSLLPANIKLHFISLLGDNLSNDTDSCIKVTYCTLIYQYCHNKHIMRQKLSLELHNNIVVKSMIVKKHLTILL